METCVVVVVLLLVVGASVCPSSGSTPFVSFLSAAFS